MPLWSSLASLGVGWFSTMERYTGAPALAALCTDYRMLRYAVLGGTSASDGAIRLRAARVSREAQFASPKPQRDAPPASSAAAEIERVLHAPFAARADVITKLWPVAYSCGQPARDYFVQ